MDPRQHRFQSPMQEGVPRQGHVHETWPPQMQQQPHYGHAQHRVEYSAPLVVQPPPESPPSRPVQYLHGGSFVATPHGHMVQQQPGMWMAAPGSVPRSRADVMAHEARHYGSGYGKAQPVNAAPTQHGYVGYAPPEYTWQAGGAMHGQPLHPMDARSAASPRIEMSPRGPQIAMQQQRSYHARPQHVPQHVPQHAMQRQVTHHTVVHQAPQHAMVHQASPRGMQYRPVAQQMPQHAMSHQVPHPVTPMRTSPRSVGGYSSQGSTPTQRSQAVTPSQAVAHFDMPRAPPSVPSPSAPQPVLPKDAAVHFEVIKVKLPDAEPPTQPRESPKPQKLQELQKPQELQELQKPQELQEPQLQPDKVQPEKPPEPEKLDLSKMESHELLDQLVEVMDINRAIDSPGPPLDAKFEQFGSTIADILKLQADILEACQLQASDAGSSGSTGVDAVKLDTMSTAAETLFAKVAGVSREMHEMADNLPPFYTRSSGYFRNLEMRSGDVVSFSHTSVPESAICAHLVRLQAELLEKHPPRPAAVESRPPPNGEAHTVRP